MENVNAQIQRVNKILRDGEPYNTKADYKGYIGYIAQFIKDAMNEVFGAGNWGVEELSSEIVDAVQYGATPNKQGVSFLAVSEVEVWIEGVKSRPRAYGETNVTLGSVGDARKGARTDAMKKALSDFSIGNRPYLGEFKKERENQGAGNNNQGRASKGNQGGANGSQGRPAAVTPNQPARKPEAAAASSQEEDKQVKPLSEIPTVSQLRARAAELNLSWNEDVLPKAMAATIATGKVTLKQFIAAGNEIHPDACKVIARYLQKYALAQTEKQAS